MAGQLRDVRMIQKAMEQRWDIKPEYKSALVRRLVAIIANPNSTAREVTSASRALIAAEAQNQSDEHSDEQIDEQRNRFLAVAERLGLETTIEQLPETGSGDDSGTASQ